MDRLKWVIDMGNKQKEENCLEIVKQLKRYEEISGNYNPDNERPDFVFENGVGLEHFLIDILTQYDGEGSIERITHSKSGKQINHYKDHQDGLDEDVENGKAAQFIENIINSQINSISDFDYDVFIQHFKDVYTNHYNNISIYRTKCSKLGFLIEIPYIQPLGAHGYIITQNGKKRNQSLKTIPITKGMINCFKYDNNVDFIILCIHPVNVGNDFYKKCQIIKVDMNNVEESIRRQGLIICDEFDYSQKFTNRDVLKLHTETSHEVNKHEI